ncbi:hypothetical protein DVS28_b0350 (plasmid) [Euzebya pacifica]|uniref:Uncharacterized protein n=1 Tax=Euzebya pacifica TaxID=1608957 RepID=A0A346Y6M3_9ACTN|nr:hypothetical protein DVS28_b0350 [Euzebya pacifica]
MIGAIGGSGFVWKAVQDDWWRPRPDPDPDGFTEPLAGGFLAMAARETTRAHTLFGQALEGVRGTGPRTAEMFGGLAELGRAICRQDATAVNNRAADRAAMWAKFVADDSEFDARIDTIDYYGLGFLAVARDWKLDITDNPAMPPGLISPFGAAESAWAAFLASGEMRSYTDRT